MRPNIPLLLLQVLAALAAPSPASAGPRHPLAIVAPSLGAPSEAECPGSHTSPADKRFRLSTRGEVTVTELVAVVGEASCQTIVVSPSVTTRGGKVSLEVPDLVTAPEVFRIFQSALEVLGFTIA